MNKWLKPGIVAAGVTILSLSGAFLHFVGGGEQYILSRDARFGCYRIPSPRDSNTDIRTVNYHRGDNQYSKPLLYMVRAMGDDWDTVQRCDELATRLTGFARDGLTSLDYKPIEGTTQYEICGITRRTPDSCELLLTLMPGDDPEATIAEITTGLKTGKGTFQRTDGGTSDGRNAWTIDTTALW